jgi:DNA-binding LacI/PurR family transcriptional regulator
MAGRRATPRINAGDVARLAGVSRSAVSRTFTAGASVAPGTRERVLAAAASLGYSPRRIPVDGRADRPVAVVMANLLSPYFAELSDRLEREIGRLGLQTMFFICSDVARIDTVFRDALARDVQGIILFSAQPSAAAMAAAQAAHVPVVILDRSERVAGASLVWIDGPETGRAVAKLMLDEGRRRPAAIATAPFRSRELTAFAEAMEAGGSAPCRWIDTGWLYEDGVRAAAELLAHGDRPDAVFAASDTLAVGFLDAGRRIHDADIPAEMSVLGFGNMPLSNWMSHRISTVHIPIGALIQTAVSTLMARIGGMGEPAPRIWLGCDIIERDSSGHSGRPGAQAGKA